MIDKRRYLRTDMAREVCTDEELARGVRGVRYSEENKYGILISRLEITDSEGEAVIGKPMGKYITVDVGRIWLDEARRFDICAEIIASELKSLASALAPKLETVLIAGLGNRHITSDSIGPLAAGGVNVTRHIMSVSPEVFEGSDICSVAAVAPGVIGQTGIETLELIKGASEHISPSLIIAIDALAAKSTERLAVTVQLSDTGIAPGSGIGNRRMAISRETLGVPVISVGVPTVVDSSTLIFDALEKAGMTDIPKELRAQLENGKSFFVTLKDTDIAAKELSRLISSSINLAFSAVL